MRADPKQSPLDPGVFARESPAFRVTIIEVMAGLLSVVWIGVVVVLNWGAAAEGGGLIARVMNGLAILTPIALLWVAIGAARTARALRQEAARLQAAIDAMRAAYGDQQQRIAPDVKPALVEKLEELAQGHRGGPPIGTPVFSSQRLAPPVAEPPATVPPYPDHPQPALALSAPVEKAPIALADFIKALDFPENQHDKDGFRALRRALEDRATERLIRASQDVLTLLSQDGIYMDDLPPDRARPEVWRRFAQGERGRAVAVLGGIHDRSSLAIVAGRMKTDLVFRDAAHHFLRQFDRSFTAFETIADDAQIADLTDTRTARAFMLLSRAAGTFD